MPKPQLPIGRPEPNDSDLAPDGGYNYRRKVRFSRASALLRLYEATIKRRGSMRSWHNIIKQYDRVPYRDEGAVLPNFGQLRSKVDKQMTQYVDYATERETWARITTQEGTEDAMTAEWSEYITRGFQKFCINPWKKKFAELMLGVKDMLLFSKGTFFWDSQYGCYPESIEIGHVWPDAESGMFADSFDTLFIRRRYRATELFQKIEDEDAAKANGWNRSAILELLASKSGLKNPTHESIYQLYSEGRIDSDAQDFLFDVVICFVQEYYPQDDEESGRTYRISQYTILERNLIPKRQGARQLTDGRIDEVGFLQELPHSRECMDHVISIVAHTVCRNFYEDPSFAQLIYTSSKTYDIVVNRILQAVEDNMRVYLQADSGDAYKKLQQMRHGNYQVLEPGIKLIQERIQRPIDESFKVLQQLGSDANAMAGHYEMGETDRKGVPKTATQSQIDLSESTRISSSHLKIFNAFVTIMMCEQYRRFTTAMDETCEGYDNYKRFVAFMNKKKVPRKAWDPENVEVVSVLNMGGGSEALKIQGARMTLEALSFAARSPGERQAQRDLIAAVHGVENVDYYLPADDTLVVNEDSLIGLENEVLSSATVNPRNVVVSPTHLHFRHIPRHIDDAELSLNAASQLFENRGSFPKDDESVMLKTITDIIIGVDHKLAHVRAHIQVAERDPSKGKAAEVKGYLQKIQDLNKAQDKLEQIIGETQQARLEESRAMMGEDPEIDHKRKMFALEEEHEARMMALKYQEATMKGEQLRSNSAANTQHKQTLETAETIHKNRLKELETASNVRTARLKSMAQKTQQPRNGSTNGKQGQKKGSSQ